MKILINNNNNISSTKSAVKSFKVFDLGEVITTIDDLLNESSIEINDQIFPVLKITENNISNYYLINNLGDASAKNKQYFTDDFIKTITIDDLILLSNNEQSSSTGNFIPLTGTENDKPVTGDIEFNNSSEIFNGITNFQTISDEFTSLGFRRFSEGVESFVGINEGDNQPQISKFIDNVNNSIFDTVSWTTKSSGRIMGIKLTSTADGILINDNSPSSRGLIGENNYSANIIDLDYTQKIYVDAPSTQTQTQRSTSTSGTDTISFDGRNGIYIHEAGLTTALTINLPVAPVDSQIVTMMSVGGITGLTLTTAVGTIVGAVTALTALVSVKFIWLASQNKWYKIN